MAVWPVSLPQSPRLQGYSEKSRDTRIKTSMEAGAEKVRNRYNAKVQDVVETYALTNAQYQSLKDFYDNTLENGTLTFTKPHPTEEVTRLYRFRNPINPTNFSGPYVEVQLDLEVLP